MPRSIPVDPGLLRKAGKLAFPEVPLHAYHRPLAEEAAQRGRASLIEVLRHMMLVRAFETMLATFKATGAYAGISYNYKGPAHLSIGQEGAAVGVALALQPEDQIFGSHRSHGEFIAKGLAAIAALPEPELQRIMEQHQDGRLLRIVERMMPAGNVKALAENFLIFGLHAEIFMKAVGFNGGMGGSMHAFFTPFGAYPNNAIVGASAGIATGAALRKKLTRSNSIALSWSGDGSTGCGPVYEAMNFAAMAQYDTLWDAPFKGGLPVLFCFTNNFYAMGGQTIGETMGFDRLSRLGAGIKASALHAETVDGTNPLAVAEAVTRKRTLLLRGDGPALLDIECYRISGHSTTDANVYRSKDEMTAWQPLDPIAAYSAALIAGGLLDADSVAAMKASVESAIAASTRAVVDPAIAPSADIAADPAYIGKLMFSHETIAVPENDAPLLAAPDTTPRVKMDAKKARFGIGANGERLSPMRAITMRDALFEPILHHMRHDERLIAYGEECRDWGGAFGVYRGLADILPYHRLFNAPISEAAIVSTAVGHALAGGRSLVELMYGDFIGRAGDEIFNQLAKWHAMSAGLLKVPVVLRCSVGSKYGAQHSQDWSALITHIPGLKVVYPATPYDAKGLMAAALSSEDPVVFFESQRLYDQVETFRPEGVPADYYRIAMGEPDVKRAGEHATVLTIGPSLFPALAAAKELEESCGLSLEVIDARSLVPFNYDPVIASVKKTGHLLVVTEASERGSFAMTLAANVTRHAFGHLKSPPRVLGSPNWIVPGADMEQTYFPQADDIIQIVTAEFHPDKAGNRRGLRNWNDLDLARSGL